jgi:hypothetical protein
MSTAPRRQGKRTFFLHTYLCTYVSATFYVKTGANPTIVSYNASAVEINNASAV